MDSPLSFGLADAHPSQLGLDDLVRDHALDLVCVFSDMDGTLLTPRSTLPDGYADAVARLRTTGVRFIPTTGRTLWSLCDMLGPITPDSDIIAGNGMDIVLAGKRVFHVEYDRGLVEELLEAVRADPERPGMVVYDEKAPYLLNITEDEFFAGRTRTSEASLFTETDRLPEGPIIKAALIARHDIGRVIERYSARFAGKLAFAACGRFWIDIPLPDAGKERAAQRVLDAFGASPSQAIAFGDSMNDAGLMQLVPASVAVGNALPELAARCSYRIGSNAEGAVVEALDAIASARMKSGKYHTRM